MEGWRIDWAGYTGCRMVVPVGSTPDKTAFDKTGLKTTSKIIYTFTAFIFNYLVRFNVSVSQSLSVTL